MAESIVSFFADKLSFLIEEESNLLLGVEEQLLFLRDELDWIRHFLRDAEKKRKKFQLVEVWVTQIRDLSYDAEDVIDAYMLHLEQRKRRNFISKTLDSWNKLKTLHQLGTQIGRINARAEKISACKLKYNLDVLESTHDSSHSNAEEMATARRRSSPIVEEIDVVGFKKESADIRAWLISGVPQRQVMSIIGMGGLGKTTLAQLVYKHKDVKSHFGPRAWISVSQEYQVRDLLLSAAKQMTTEAHSSLEKKNESELRDKLRVELEQIIYLVVIDDIWKVEAWDYINAAFPSNDMGSRVILTTRNKEVALHADPSTRSHLELRLLTKEESWELFCQKVFSGGSCPQELKEFGEKIVDKCGGLPLGIVVIGGLLMGKERTPVAWSRVLDSGTWLLSQDSNQCRQILNLSYTDLSYHLKSCFLYLGHFPEDFEIEARKLILLWVVQVRGEQQMEHVAEDCLEELVQRSMIQVTRRVYQGGPVEKFRIHDLLRDLAISEARNDRFLDIYTNNYHSATTTRSRRLAVHHSTTTSIANLEQFPAPAAPKLRSLLVFDKMFDIGMFWKSAFGDGKKMLRVLDIEGVAMKTGLPKEIGELVFLHYLGLRKTTLDTLPSSIGNLQKLQTLALETTVIKILPQAIWKLKSLRHLFLSEHSQKFDMAKLKGVPIKDFCRNLLSLSITSLNWMILSDDIVKLGCLRSLEIQGKVVLDNGQDLKDCFPSSLTELSLYFSDFEQDPSDALGSLPKLKSLHLYRWSNTGNKMVFSNGGFPQLEFLHLDHISKLEEWNVEDAAIPSLRHLVIHGCANLQKLPNRLKHIVSFQKLEVVNMPPTFTVRVKENGDDWDIIKDVPLISIT